MNAFLERPVLSAVAESVIYDKNESDEVKAFLDRTLCTGQRYSMCKSIFNEHCWFMYSVYVNSDTK